MRIARYRVVSSIGAVSKKREKKKREKINLESDVALRPRAISSPLAGRRNVSPCGEKERCDDIEVGKPVRPQLAMRVGDVTTAWKKVLFYTVSIGQYWLVFTSPLANWGEEWVISPDRLPGSKQPGTKLYRMKREKKKREKREKKNLEMVLLFAHAIRHLRAISSLDVGEKKRGDRAISSPVSDFFSARGEKERGDRYSCAYCSISGTVLRSAWYAGIDRY
ncbi:hypothetical protein GW17_00025157 [Ensete ventricosum]|nr:hypothetical protein GW17_00025157 [Ensete ventricosum]